MSKIIPAHMGDDWAANMAVFLLEKTGSIYGRFYGRIPAKDQRRLFGRFLGKGQIEIDGAQESLRHYVKVCFGLDSDCTVNLQWRQLY